MIESLQNETFKKLRSLTLSKGLREEGLLLLSGAKLVHEFLQKPHLAISFEVRLAEMVPLVPSAVQIVFSKALFDTVDVLGTHSNILCLKQPEVPRLTADDLASYTPQGIEVVAPLGDPQNLGALIRTAEAFDVRRVILTEEAAHPFLPKSIKASAGSVLRMPLAAGPPLTAFPRAALALAMDGDPIDAFPKPQSALLVIGEEGRGLGDVPFTQRLRVPTHHVESLNVVVAAGIALFCLSHR